jgi:hypothetical protein
MVGCKVGPHLLPRPHPSYGGPYVRQRQRRSVPGPGSRERCTTDAEPRAPTICRVRARPSLQWPLPRARWPHLRGSEQFSGSADGLASEAGELRCAAQACVGALSQAVAGDLGFELLGVKAVRAFDSTVVIVSLSITHQDAAAYRVVGSYLTDNDPPRGAALAVLNATNRILGNRLYMR